MSETEFPKLIDDFRISYRTMVLWQWAEDKHFKYFEIEASPGLAGTGSGTDTFRFRTSKHDIRPEEEKQIFTHFIDLYSKVGRPC